MSHTLIKCNGVNIIIIKKIYRKKFLIILRKRKCTRIIDAFIDAGARGVLPLVNIEASEVLTVFVVII